MEAERRHEREVRKMYDKEEERKIQQQIQEGKEKRRKDLEEVSLLTLHTKTIMVALFIGSP